MSAPTFTTEQLAFLITRLGSEWIRKELGDDVLTRARVALESPDELEADEVDG